MPSCSVSLKASREEVVWVVSTLKGSSRQSEAGGRTKGKRKMERFRFQFQLFVSSWNRDRLSLTLRCHLTLKLKLVEQSKLRQKKRGKLNSSSRYAN